MLKNLCVKNCVEKTLAKEPLKFNPQEQIREKIAPTQFQKWEKRFGSLNGFGGPITAFQPLASLNAFRGPITAFQPLASLEIIV